jgi:glutamyl-Q tRNA(Asp) synthetase
MGHYIGRFAPSPTGALHAGSLVAAFASWLDARAHGGKWLVRIEDVDTPRCIAGADKEILRQLAACGLLPDEVPVYQSQRSHLYQAALDQLIDKQAVYPCACSRKDIEAALAAQGVASSRHGELVYPGTCRGGLAGRTARAWRFDTQFFMQNRPLAGINTPQNAMEIVAIHSSSDHQGGTLVRWHDRRLGPQEQNVSIEVGDFVLRRADGLWAYQLAVVVDDADQGITHIVRGEDLTDNTARQILLQQSLSLPAIQYLHTPLVLAGDGFKLSKQNGALPLVVDSAGQINVALRDAAAALGLSVEPAYTLGEILQNCIRQWQNDV